MMGKIWGHYLRQKRNIEIFHAYSWWDLLGQTVTLPKDLFLGKGSASAPLNVALFITLRCNLRCTMCNLLEMLQKGEEPVEPSTGQVETLCKELKELGCPGLILFGGEPYIRKDFGSLVDIVKNAGLSCGTFTNGTMLDDRAVDETTGLDYLVFSLLGPREIHNEITQNEKSYERLIAGAKKVAKRKKSSLIFHCTITKENIYRLHEVVEVGKEVGVDLVRFGHPTFYTGADADRARRHIEKAFAGKEIRCTSAHYEINNDETRVYVTEIERLRQKYGSLIAFAPELSASEIVDWYNPNFKTDRECLFTYRGSFIKPNGDVVPCESFDYPLGNAFKDGFVSVWQGPVYKEFRQKVRQGLFPGCARCCKL